MQDLSELKLIRFCYESCRSVIPLEKSKISYMDLTYCLDGKMTYVYEGKEYLLSSGDCILFPQGSVRIRKGSSLPTSYCSFNIASERFAPRIKGYVPHCLHFDTVRTIESVKKAFDSMSEMRVQKCLALFYYLYCQLLETVENNEHPYIRQIKKYVAEHYREKITLEAIASAVHLTPQYCCTLFAKCVGQTLFDFITAKRIEEAQSLMITTSMHLTEIAALCGFEEYNYFSRIFKKVTGTPPRQYRMLHTLFQS